MTADAIQQTLDGTPATSPIDPQRVLIKVTGNTRRRLRRSACLRRFTMIELVEMSTKLAAILLNELSEEDIRAILETDDPNEIIQTFSNLFF